jgi:hypothetical protein
MLLVSYLTSGTYIQRNMPPLSPNLSFTDIAWIKDSGSMLPLTPQQYKPYHAVTALTFVELMACSTFVVFIGSTRPVPRAASSGTASASSRVEGISHGAGICVCIKTRQRTTHNKDTNSMHHTFFHSLQNIHKKKPNKLSHARHLVLYNKHVISPIPIYNH